MASRVEGVIEAIGTIDRVSLTDASTEVSVPVIAALAATPVPAKVQSSARILGYDIVRAMAAMGVIWVHAGRSDDWNRYNLSAAGSWGPAFLNTLAGFFVVITLRSYLKGGSKSEKGVSGFALHRIWRLYGAFVVWSLVYAAARIVNFYLFHKATMLKWDWSLLFFGTTYHLWFLPYLLIVTLATLPIIAPAMASRRAMMVTSVIITLGATTLMLLPEPSWLASGGASTLPLFHLYSRAPGYLFGVGIGLWMAAGFRPRVDVRLALAAMAIVVFTTSQSLLTDFPRHILNRIGAVAAFVVALGPWGGQVARFLGTMGKLGFGVYLCHVLFVEGLIEVGARLHLPSCLTLDLCVFAGAVACSFTAAYLMRQVRVLAWLIP